MNNFKNLFIVLIFIFIASCSNNIRIEGNFIFPNNLDRLRVGLSKEQVFEILGPSTVNASFNENTWYYMYEISTRKLRFLNKNITDSKVVVINFEGNTIKTFEIIDYKERKQIPLDTNQTKDILIKTKPDNKKLRKADSF